MISEMEHNPAEAMELAAARSAVEGSALLSRAFAATGLSQRELASRVGVTEGRVSQILGEAVNLRLSTVGRYLQAMGYRLSLSATDADGNVIDSGRTAQAARETTASTTQTVWNDATPVLVAA